MHKNTIILPAFTISILIWLSLSFGGRIDISDWKMQDASKATQTGQAISATDYNPSNWYKGVVPGTVLTTLVENKEYEDPYFAKNAYSIPDIAHAKKKFWYRAVFTVPSSYSGKRVWLNFDGINYIAEIYVNGKSVGTMKGAFKRAKYDVTSIVTVGGSNCCAVLISPPPSTDPTSPYTETYHDKTTTHCHQNGGKLTQDGPTFFSTQGWDWIPTIPDRSMGIWQEVYLEETGPLAIRFPFVKTDLPLPSTSSADLSISCRVQNATSSSVDGVLKGVIYPGGITFQKQFTANASGTTEVSFTADNTSQLKISNPLLWWPRGYGSPNLYTCKLTVETPQGTVSDTATVRFGIREITRLDNGKGGLLIGMNGKKILTRGGNWGMDEAMKKVSSSRFRGQVGLHALANLNMIRNWVGNTDDEDFYNQCNENGIMVWEDFWLANWCDGPPNALPDFKLFMDNAEDKILRIRSHPCVVLWCCRNESGPPANFEKELKKLTTDLDGTRIFIKNSGADGTRSIGPYTYQDAHNYDKIIGEQPANSFHTELGSVNVPTVETMRLMMSEKDLDPKDNILNAIWAWHDFCGSAPGATGWNAAQPKNWNNAMNSLYGKPTDIVDYCKRSQFLSYVTFRAMFEAVNIHYPHNSTGLLLWMSNPCWPTTVWQLYDYYLDPTAGLYGVKSACEPLHIQLNLNSRQVQVMNIGAAISGLKAEAIIYDPSGKEKWRKSETVNAAAEKLTGSLTLEVPSSISDVYFTKLNLLDGDNKTLSSNFYWLSKNGSFKSTFEQLPKQPLAVSLLSTSKTADTVRMKVSVKHTGTTAPILMIQLKVLGNTTGKRFLPVFISENYFSMLPGETRLVDIHYFENDANGQTMKLEYDGWNVQPGIVSNTHPTPAPSTDGLLARRGNAVFLNVPQGVPYSVELYNLAGKRLSIAKGIGTGKSNMLDGRSFSGNGARICVIRTNGTIVTKFRSVQP